MSMSINKIYSSLEYSAHKTLRILKCLNVNESNSLGFDNYSTTELCTMFGRKLLAYKSDNNLEVMSRTRMRTCREVWLVTVWNFKLCRHKLTPTDDNLKFFSWIPPPKLKAVKFALNALNKVDSNTNFSPRTTVFLKNAVTGKNGF